MRLKLFLSVEPFDTTVNSKVFGTELHPISSVIIKITTHTYTGCIVAYHFEVM